MKNLKKSKGITLIALVITIIVLLILAGVSIATLTGENGVLTKASKAKNETQKERAREKVQIAVMGSYGTDREINIEELNANLKNVEGLTYEGSSISETNKIESLEDDVIVQVDGYDVIINGNGKVGLEEEQEIEDSVIHFSVNDKNLTVRTAVFEEEWEGEIELESTGEKTFHFPTLGAWLCRKSSGFAGFTFDMNGYANDMYIKHNGREVKFERNGTVYANHPSIADPPQEGDKFILTYEDTGERVPLES